jgi:hypothetical protein
MFTQISYFWMMVPPAALSANVVSVLLLLIGKENRRSKSKQLFPIPIQSHPETNVISHLST